MIGFYVQSSKLLKNQRQLRGFVETNVNKKYQYFALFDKIHHVFDKSLYLPLLGGEMCMLLRIDFGNKQYTAVWHQPGASGSFCLLQPRAAQPMAPTGREVHGAFLFKKKSVLYHPAHFQKTLSIRNGMPIS